MGPRNRERVGLVVDAATKGLSAPQAAGRTRPAPQTSSASMPPPMAASDQSQGSRGHGHIGPCEALRACGPEHLADAQLLAVLLDEPSLGRAEGILEASGGLGSLIALGPADLASLGMTPSEASRVAVVLEIYRRSPRAPLARINSPQAAAAYLLPKAAGLTEERFGILCLNARGDVIADRILAMGTPLGLVITPREGMKEALRFGATNVLVWHNHPAGSSDPSREDIALTRQLREAGAVVGVPLNDHIIVGRDTWFSFRVREKWDRR